MQSFLAERFTAGRYRDAAFGAYEAARAMAQARAFVTAAVLFLPSAASSSCFGSRRRT